MCFSASTREAVSNKDGTGIPGTCHHHTGLVGSGGVAGADGSTAGRAQLCREWRAVLMMARERAHAESAESQAHGRDARRITKYGDLVKY